MEFTTQISQSEILEQTLIMSTTQPTTQKKDKMNIQKIQEMLSQYHDMSAKYKNEKYTLGNDIIIQVITQIKKNKNYEVKKSQMSGIIKLIQSLPYNDMLIGVSKELHLNEIELCGFHQLTQKIGWIPALPLQNITHFVDFLNLKQINKESHQYKIYLSVVMHLLFIGLSVKNLTNKKSLVEVYQNHIQYELFQQPKIFNQIFKQWYCMFIQKMSLNFISLNEMYNFIQEKKYIYKQEEKYNYQQLIQDLMQMTPQCEKDRKIIEQFLLKRVNKEFKMKKKKDFAKTSGMMKKQTLKKLSFQNQNKQLSELKIESDQLQLQNVIIPTPIKSPLLKKIQQSQQQQQQVIKIPTIVIQQQQQNTSIQQEQQQSQHQVLLPQLMKSKQTLPSMKSIKSIIEEGEGTNTSQKRVHLKNILMKAGQVHQSQPQHQTHQQQSHKQSKQSEVQNLHMNTQHHLKIKSLQRQHSTAIYNTRRISQLSLKKSVNKIPTKTALDRTPSL